ncbi:hypothetical protein K1718_02415 [Roseibium porphyridii]|uniref:N-acetyltransferase domain-containing protein n=1 Tax=Roseibium porphyridii TaxID=2866279 RepID=A0ABY8F3Z1_9HYPH|nr:hypothetical protein [Roseibium sp. KMA01]WFE90222.1 hypothetical protein K1718_02415 [Roseibium sp. KMA01]
MDSVRQSTCAHNNALWCDSVLKAAGANSRFQTGFWSAEDKVLPLYPNVVTLTKKPGAELYSVLRSLPSGASVKDSFDALDLSALGFQKLFSATWLFRSDQTNRKPPVSSDWLKINHLQAFKKWLQNWNGNEALHNVLPARLMDVPTVEFAAIQKDGDFRAGAVFNSGPKLEGRDVIGLSNIFCRRSWLYSALHDLLAPFPHKSVCTYENDETILPVYRQLGFEDCGHLRVWTKI